MEQARPEIVLSSGCAVPCPRCLYRDPLYTYSTNVMGNCQHIGSSAPGRRRVGSWINVTSDKCYQNQEQPSAYREGDPWAGAIPAVAARPAPNWSRPRIAIPSSAMLARVARIVAVASARAGNVLGGGDWAEDRLIPDSIRALSRRMPIRDPQPQCNPSLAARARAARGYHGPRGKALVRTALRFTGGWNFGPGDANAKPVSWVVERLGEAMGTRCFLIPDTGNTRTRRTI